MWFGESVRVRLCKWAARRKRGGGVGLVCAGQLGDGAWDTRIGRGPEEEATDRGSERAGRQVESVAAKERSELTGVTARSR